ncbi:MAG TPA: phenylalanine--tRNA ligase beta subunit-related protein [Ktedonobacteraceae bacterium]|nr:phenylalanine--tRNA ligase beta subunit-related protein [Ktedonobacteraceae bacterium]
MRLVIDKDIITLFPDLRIGVVTGRGIQNGSANEEVERIKQSAAAGVRQNLSTEALSQHPSILAWREAYRCFGAKPKDHRPTAEALLRRILRGEGIPTISRAVDLYLAVEAEFYLPIGGYDLDKVDGDIALRRSAGDESFIPIGAAAAEETTTSGEVVYADARKVLTRRWNYRDCDAAKVTADSQNIALFCEAPFPEIPTDQLRKCTDRLADYLQRFCGGSISVHFIEAQSKQVQEL